jgi:hypothetical protein
MSPRQTLREDVKSKTVAARSVIIRSIRAEDSAFGVSIEFKEQNA